MLITSTDPQTTQADPQPASEVKLEDAGFDWKILGPAARPALFRCGSNGFHMLAWHLRM